MAGVRTFRDLIAYQRARELAKLVRAHTRAFPREERYELTAQINRAVHSVPLNIAEGFGVGTNPGMLRYLRIARGSLFETDAGLEGAGDIGLPPPSMQIVELIAETDRVLQGLIRSMEKRAESDSG